MESEKGEILMHPYVCFTFFVSSFPFFVTAFTTLISYLT